MISNEHERSVTERKLVQLTEAVEVKTSEPLQDGRDLEMHQLVIDGFHTLIAELRAELSSYAEADVGRKHNRSR